MGRRFRILLAILALLVAASFGAFRNLGLWLVRPDPPRSARAIVVLSGRAPFRAMEAAELYRKGYASEVWLFQDQPSDVDAAFLRLGIKHPAEQEYDQQVLERLGVPQTAIRILMPPTTNTASELRRVAQEAGQQGADKVIVVTSPVHTRRTRLIWRLAVGDYPEAIVCADHAETADLEHWWRSTEDAQSVEHEVLGLMNAYLGLALKPRRG